MDVGEKMRIALKARGMSQAELAKNAHVTEASISRYITGERYPKWQIAKRIADVLGVSLDWLADRDTNDDAIGKERVMINMKLWDEKLDIEKEFDENNTELMMTVYKDGKPQIWTMQNTKVLAFNVWSYLTKAQPTFDEIHIRVATEEEVKEWYEDSPFDADISHTDCGWAKPTTVGSDSDKED